MTKIAAGDFRVPGGGRFRLLSGCTVQSVIKNICPWR